MRVSTIFPVTMTVLSSAITAQNVGESCDQPGAYTCDGALANNVTCNNAPQLEWVESAACLGPDHCGIIGDTLTLACTVSFLSCQVLV